MTDSQEKSIGETFVEEINEINRKQRKCRHTTIERIDGEKVHWDCQDCGLHFKPKELKEADFLEWAENSSYINYGDELE